MVLDFLMDSTSAFLSFFKKIESMDGKNVVNFLFYLEFLTQKFLLKIIKNSNFSDSHKTTKIFPHADRDLFFDRHATATKSVPHDSFPRMLN